MSPGDYSLTVERAGFATARWSGTVALGNVVLSFSLQVAGVEESLTVESGGPGPDSREVQTGATFGRQELDSIPTARDPWAILQQVPGVLLVNVSVGPGSTAHQQSYAGKGSPGGQNSYNLDGSAISLGGITPMFFDFDSLDTIEVTTGGSNLSLASPGVALNLVTKRGTNDLKGSARAYYTGESGWEYGAEAGGRSGRTASGFGGPSRTTTTPVRPSRTFSTRTSRTGISWRSGTPSSMPVPSPQTL